MDSRLNLIRKSCLLLVLVIDFKRYPSTYCLMQGGCFICRDDFTSKLESQPLIS